MDFLETQLLDEAASGPGIMEVLSRNSAGIINSLAFVAVAFLVVWLGVRPLVRTVTGNGAAAGQISQRPQASNCRISLPAWMRVLVVSWKGLGRISASTAPTIFWQAATAKAPSTAGFAKDPSAGSPAWWKSAKNAQPRYFANGQWKKLHDFEKAGVIPAFCAFPGSWYLGAARRRIPALGHCLQKFSNDTVCWE